jgi:hypothetical protein
MPDDALEPFSPGGIDPNFDDIEPEPEPALTESSIPPLLQARGLRASPSIQVIESHVTGASDPNKQCYDALCALRKQVRWHFYIFRLFLYAHGLMRPSIAARKGREL